MLAYNFHDRLLLMVDTAGHQGYRNYFENEYSRIASVRTVEGIEASILVKIVKGLPAPREGDKCCSVRVKGLFTFQYLLRNLHTSSVEIYFKEHWVDKVYMNAIAVFLQAQIVEPVMYYLLLQQKVLFMHAAGVSDGKRGYLFPARGGAGKTTFSIALLRYGYRLLGDDLLFVDVDRKLIEPYPRPLHLFTYNIGRLPGATVPIRFRLAIFCKDLLRVVLELILRTEFLISTRVHADEIFSENPFGEAVPYTGVYFLRSDGPAISEVKVDRSNSLSLTREIIASADLNKSLYALVGDQRAVSKVFAMEESVVQELVEQFSRFSYINTRELDLSNLQSFLHSALPNCA